MYQRVGKPLIDFMLAIIGLIVTSPLWLVLVIVLTIVNRGSPFFIQLRSGRFGCVFYIIKFKSMTERRDNRGQLLSDADRMTTVGRWLRRTSLDELPQLLNILRGEMSLVGPRPQLVAYWPLYSPDQLRRHDVRPGLTGWAQVNGRNALSWDEMFVLDNWYIAHRSLWLDLKILCLTAIKLLSRRGVIHAETASRPRFTGTSAS